MVVDFDGRVLAQADPGSGEKVVVAPIDIDALRHERSRRLGHDTVSHHRSEAYTYSGRPGLAPHPGPITPENLRDRVSGGERPRR